MARADVMLLSSQYEGFPNVVLESHAFGVPVIAFDCPGGTKEIIEDGVNGLLIESGNVERLLESIVNYDKRSFISSSIKNIVEEKYALSTIIGEYESHFFRIL